jgi:hypothetical protein
MNRNTAGGILGAIAFSAALVASSSSARAEWMGTAEQRAACRPDVFRLCAGEIPNHRAITACLIAHRASLSPGCAAAFSDPPGGTTPTRNTSGR